MKLDEADFSMTEHAFIQNPQPGQAPGYGPQPGDDALLVKFFKEPIEDPVKTKAQGRPIFMEVDFIEISRPGDRNNVLRRPASDRDKARFPRHWDAYHLRNEESYIEGTLLSDWPRIKRSQVEELAYFNVRTVEQLSKIADSNATFMHGILDLKQSATAYLAACKDSAAGERLNAELEIRDGQISALTQQVAELKTMLTQQLANVAAAPAPVPVPAAVVAPPPEVVPNVISPDALLMDPDDAPPEIEVDLEETMELTPEPEPETPKRKRRPRKRTQE